MRHKQIKNFIVGGALMGALLFSVNAFAYDQFTTHPALTSQIVNFYNLNFTEKLSKEDKAWIIQGSIDEDQGMRPMNHFYDPVHNIGMAGFPTSKQWAMSSAAQSNFAIANKSIAESAGLFKSADDFSYPRAINDYAQGDRQRAMIAFGHVLHLLEDANVPDHTRNDPHPPFIHGQESPYEHEMAKWNPENFNIAPELKKEGLKPVILSNLGEYFDKIAKYSNGNFFSKDTISNENYDYPNTKIIKKIIINGKEILSIAGKDRDGKEFPLAVLETQPNGNSKEIKAYLTTREIGPAILNGYWDRLSKDIVLNGTGALNLLLTEAEKAKKEYASRPPEKPNWFSKILGLIGISTGDKVVDNQTIGDIMVTPTPIVTKLSVSPASLVTKTPDTNVTIPTPTLSPLATPTPSVTPVKTSTSTPTPQITYISSGGGGGGGSATSPTHTPTPSPTPTPSTSPTPTLSPTPTSTPTPTPPLSPSPTLSSSPSPQSPPTSVVINEIAWMGTATSSNDEWIELYNNTNSAVDLTGWTLKSKDGTPAINLDSKTIAPFGFYLLERTRDTVVSDVSADQIYTGALGNGGEYLELKDGSDNLQDFVDNSSGWYAGDNTTKSSMERIDPRQSGDNAANWVTNNGIIKNGHDAGGNPINGTPRAKNSVYVSLKPSAVTDLVAGHHSPTITATWSAPDSGGHNTDSLSYDLRYSLTGFPASNSWNLATQIASSSLPSVGEKGASQNASFAVAYQYGQTAYFALKTKVILHTTIPDVVSKLSNVATVSFPTAINPNSWAMLGKDQFHTSFAANIAGPGPTATISWEFKAGAGFAVSQPVMSDTGNVYFGTSDGSSSKLISLDKNGVKQWEYPVNVSIGTPAVLSDGSVYFGRVGAGGSLAFTALNPDGSKKWDYNDASTVKQITVSSKGEPHFTYQSGSQDKLAVLNPDGSVKKIIVGGPGLSGFSPIVLENGVIIVASYVSGNQFFTAYSAAGVQLWQQFYTGANGNGPSNLSHDRVTGKTYSAAGAQLLDIPADGSVVHASNIAPWDYSAAMMVAISPGTLYVGFNSANPASGSLLYALNKADLAAKWSFLADGYLNKQLAVDSGGNTYFSTQNGKLYSVDSAGKRRWVIDSAASTSDISPALTENGLIWGYGNRLISVK